MKCNLPDQTRSLRKIIPKYLQLLASGIIVPLTYNLVTP
jgi:hypothetical protein